MTTIHFIGGSSSRGTYYFYAERSRGWVVADLDTGMVSLHSKLSLVRLVADLDMSRAKWKLIERSGLGQDGDRWLVDGEDLLPLLDEFAEELQALSICDEDGNISEME